MIDNDQFCVLLGYLESDLNVCQLFSVRSFHHSEDTSQNNENSMKNPFIQEQTYSSNNVTDYEWPPSSNDRWVIQEQFVLFLDVSGFKRKYPKISRRQLHYEEVITYGLESCCRGFLRKSYFLKWILTEYIDTVYL